MIEAVLGVEVDDHDTFNQTVKAQLHATDANQKVEELFSVLERGARGGGFVTKEIHDGLHKAFSMAVANEDALKYFRSDLGPDTLNHLYHERRLQEMWKLKW